MYKIYPTLLDSFQYYLNSEEEGALQTLIDKINRVPSEKSPEALAGIAFNEVVDKIVVDPGAKTIVYGDFEFDADLVRKFQAKFEGALKQGYTSGVLETRFGKVLLYGIFDNVKMDTAADIKTTRQFECPKYLNSSQHRVYLYCLNQQGVKVNFFEYAFTDFKGLFSEMYTWKPERDIPYLRAQVEHFIGFIEKHRHLITDKKIFGLA